MAPMGPMTGGLPAWGRLSTSSKRLDPSWQFIDPEAASPLDAKGAFETIAGNDPRPILLLRDCAHSEKDNSKVGAYLEDERVVLAMHWFHLVRVNKEVVKPEHPLHALFAEGTPHMMLLSGDGKERIPIALMPSSNALWGQMLKMLKREYKNSADESVTKWRMLLTEFDKLDKEYAKLVGDESRSGGEKAEGKLADRRASIEEKRAKLVSDERKLKDLGFKDPTAYEKLKGKTKDESWRDKLLGKPTPPDAPAQK